MTKPATPHGYDGVLQRDDAGNIIQAFGDTVPTATTAGYAAGCIFHHRDATALSYDSLYVNEGTASSCNFFSIGGDVGQMGLTSTVSGRGMVGGVHTTVAATDTVVTGLTTVIAVVASFRTDPADAQNLVTATIGNQAGAPAAGSIIIATFKHDGTDPTPVAATSFGAVVNWIAFGTL